MGRQSKLAAVVGNMLKRILGRMMPLGLLAVATGAALGGCEDGAVTCTLVGCQDSATLTADLPEAVGDLNIEVCVNDSCIAGALGRDDECVTLAGEPLTSACLADAAGGLQRLTLAVTFDSWGGVKDGDRYRLRVSDDQAGVLIDGTETADYTDHYPNGPECDPPCRSVSIDFETR